MFQAQEQLQADVLRYKAKIEDLEKELTMKGQVGHTNAHRNESVCIGDGLNTRNIKQSNAAEYNVKHSLKG